MTARLTWLLVALATFLATPSYAYTDQGGFGVGLESRVWTNFSEPGPPSSDFRLQLAGMLQTTDLASTATASGVGLLFQAHLYDYETGLYLMRARVYDPRTGSFLQRDPEGFVDSANPYAGMAWDPIKKRDPTSRATGGPSPEEVVKATLDAEFLTRKKSFGKEMAMTVFLPDGTKEELFMDRVTTSRNGLPILIEAKGTAIAPTDFTRPQRAALGALAEGAEFEFHAWGWYGIPSTDNGTADGAEVYGNYAHRAYRQYQAVHKGETPGTGRLSGARCRPIETRQTSCWRRRKDCLASTWRCDD